MVFMVVPGTDEFDVKVCGAGSVLVMGKTMDDTLGESKKVKISELLAPVMLDVDLGGKGAVRLAAQLLPLAETSMLPLALSATRNQLDLANRRSEALEMQCAALTDALGELQSIHCIGDSFKVKILLENLPPCFSGVGGRVGGSKGTCKCCTIPGSQLGRGVVLLICEHHLRSFQS